MKMTYYILNIDIYKIHLHVNNDDDKTFEVLNEAEDHGIKLGGTYSALKHKPHTVNNDYHLHIRNKGTEIAALNFDGTAHDGYHNFRLPNTVVKGIQKCFPKCNIPSNGLIETASSSIQQEFALLFKGVLNED